MKYKKIISALSVAAAIATTSISALAKEVTVETDIYMPDEICGYLHVSPTTATDIYVKIYKLTPETEKEDYIVYDYIIEADAVHVSDIYTFPLELNNLNSVNGKYESSYEINIGVNKYTDSTDENDIVYHTVNLEVEDSNYTGNETNCSINVKVTKDQLEQPACVESGERLNKIYDLTFANYDKEDETEVIETTEEKVILKGDANLDKKVNVRDCAAIATALAKGNVSKLTEEADYNNDGKINVRDAAAIASFLAGGGTVPDPTEPSTDPTEPTTTTKLTTASSTTAKPANTEVIDATDPTEPTEEATTELPEESEPTEPSSVTTDANGITTNAPSDEEAEHPTSITPAPTDSQTTTSTGNA